MKGIIAITLRSDPHFSQTNGCTATRVFVDFRKKPRPGRPHRCLIHRLAFGNRFEGRGFMLHCACLLPRLRSALGHMLHFAPSAFYPR